MTPHVLIVAGSDSSGGAGIVRDIETVAAFGLRGALAVSAVTVQTHARVEHIEQMPPDLVAAQMRAAFGLAAPSEIPPPLTPPHKGEGDCLTASPARIVSSVVEQSANKDGRKYPPPPCGEGLGVGVSRAQEEPNLEWPSTPIAAIKIGMLGTAAAIDAVAAVLASAPPVPVVLDPVLASTSGRALLDNDAIDALIGKLLPLSQLVTPNLPELALLTRQPLAVSRQDIVIQAGMLLAAGAKAVLVKGGHALGTQSIDILVTPDHAPQAFEARRLTGAMRGTGCMLASAIAAQLALGHTLEASVASAKRHVFTRLAANQAAQPAQPQGLSTLGHSGRTSLV